MNGKLKWFAEINSFERLQGIKRGDLWRVICDFRDIRLKVSAGNSIHVRP